MNRVTTLASAAVGPDFGALGGAGTLRSMVGALLTYGLLTSALMVIICAAAWAIASSSGSRHPQRPRPGSSSRSAARS